MHVDWVSESSTQSITLCGGEGEDIGTGQTLCPDCAQVVDALNVCVLGPESLREIFDTPPDWDREAVFSMLTGKDNLKGEDLPARLTKDDVMAYIDKLFAQHESKTHT